MKISIVTGFFLPVPPVAGGATEKIWHRLAREFAAAGHEVTFVSRNWPGFPDRETRDGVVHIRVKGVNHTSSLLRNLWHDFWWGVRVARILPAADVTICNTVALPVWLRRFHPAAGRVIAVVARMPKGQGRVYGAVDLILSLSGAVTAKLQAENSRLASRIAPFPFPIDWQLHANAAAGRRPAGADASLIIGYIGRVHPEKGLSLLIGAANRLAAQGSALPPWRLEIVGPTAVSAGGGGDSFRESLVRQADPALVPKVTFRAPEYDAARLAQYYARIDVFCYPSVAEKGETFGVAIAEAMAAGCAPVVSDLACFRELVREGETGLVFNHAAPDAEERLADRLATLLTDAGLRQSLARTAQAHAQRFDFSESARALLATLTQLVGNPGENRVPQRR